MPKWRHTRDEQSLDAFRFVVLACDVEGSVAIVVTHIQSGTIWSALGTKSLNDVLGRDSGVVIDCVLSLILYLPRDTFAHQQL